MDKYINQSITVWSVPGLGDAIDIAKKASYAAHLGKLFRKKKN